MTRNGEVVASDGLMDPMSKVDLNMSKSSNRNTHKNGFVFGAQPAKAREDFKHAEEDVEAIDAALPLLQSLDDLTQDLDAHCQQQEDIAEKEEELLRLEGGAR